jgi:UDP-N-acetylglucosamine 2-epimerase (non-hydrolysing)
VAATRQVLAEGVAAPPEGPPLWDGHAGERIAAVVVDWLATRARLSSGSTA